MSSARKQANGGANDPVRVDFIVFPPTERSKIKETKKRWKRRRRSRKKKKRKKGSGRKMERKEELSGVWKAN